MALGGVPAVTEIPWALRLVDLIVAGARSRADSVEEIGGTIRLAAVGSVHCMNHMAGWAR